MADYGYDVADYTNVDPMFGSLEDFDALLEGAHRRGIRVIVDWVPNHTSDQHPWFVESCAGRESPKRDWYVWRDPAPGGGPPNDWQSAFGAVGPAWTFDPSSGQYYLHSFLPEQPDLNWDNPVVREAMHDVLRFWLDRGVDGFRIDVIFKLGKDPQLSEHEPGRRHDQDWPTVHERLRAIRAVVEEYDERMLVGEVYLLNLRQVVEYINTGDELHLAHNFVFVHLPWDAEAFRASVEEFELLADARAWPAWFLENHDHKRVPTRYAGSGDPASGARRGRLALLLVCALRGTPFIFQGEELGLPDAVIPPERVVDVDGRDGERAPVPWRRPSTAGPGAGFTDGAPWLPIVADAERLSVESQERDPNSTLAFARRLIALRSREPALQSGAQRSIEAAPAVFGFVRELGSERFAIVLNFSSQTLAAQLGEDLGARAVVALSTETGRPAGEEIEPRALELGPDEGLVLRLGAA